MSARLDEHDDDDDLDPRRLLLVVVGAHLRAEVDDRPAARRLQRRIAHWQEGNLPEGERLRAVVCTDLWYLNAPELLAQPTISIGRPQLNAATARMAGRLPTVFVVQDALAVQLDPDLAQLRACVWGVDRRATATAVDHFLLKHLERFLRCAHGLPMW
jgi:hypothetical protein